MNRGNPVDFPGIGAAEDEAVVHVPFDGADEGLGDTVGVVLGSQVLRQWKQLVTGILPCRKAQTKGFSRARPGMWTGLCTMVTSEDLALTYIFLKASAASHSFVATKRVAICTPERPRER